MTWRLISRTGQSSAPGQWTHIAPNTVFTMQADRSYHFAIGISRDNIVMRRS